MLCIQVTSMFKIVIREKKCIIFRYELSINKYCDFDSHTLLNIIFNHNYITNNIEILYLYYMPINRK